MDEYSNIYMCLTFISISLIYNVCEKHIFHGDLVKWIEGFQKEKFCKYYIYECMKFIVKLSTFVTTYL